MKKALVAIGRRENQYAREWVEHYLKLGFDHIFICDNNHGNEEFFEDVLDDFVDTGMVSIHGYRDQISVQMEAYTDMYAQYGKVYDWIAFFDFDEYLILQDATLDEWLGRFVDTDADAILVNWMCMTDGGMIYNDGRKLMERFTEPVPYDTPVQYDFPDNDHIKSIVRGGREGLYFKANPHIPDNAKHCYTADGKKCKHSPFQPYDFKVAYLKHFVTKTISEYMGNKWEKGVGATTKEKFLQKYKGRFFKYNELTEEKQCYMETYERNRSNKVTVCIVNYNTTLLTQRAIQSLWKHSPGVGVIVFDNSDKEPFPPMKGVEILDNTKGQIIDFSKWIAQFHDKARTSNEWASAKHCYTVQWLINKRRNPFILMDSDVLIKQDISEFWDRKQAFVGQVKAHYTQYAITVDRVLPFLCFINVPMLKNSGVTYYNFPKMYALTQKRPDMAYDTGCWFLEDVNAHCLPYHVVNIEPYVIHLGHASWKSINPNDWLERFREYWE